MQLSIEQLKLELEVPFKISYGATTVRENILVHLKEGKFSGVGEAAVVPYYNETTARVSHYLKHIPLEILNTEFLEDTLRQLPLSESSMAKQGIDLALHDLWGKQLGQPLYRLWGLNPDNCPLVSFTIGMEEDVKTYREKLHDSAQYPLLKLKLGSGDPDYDLKMVKMARTELGDHILCVDANGGWSAEEALTMIPKMADYEMIFVEQPVAKADFDGWRTLRKSLPVGMPPLIADESVQGVESVLPLVGLADGINIKLAKCGGLRPARQMITLARAHGLQLMIGCMVESSVAISAAAQLAPLMDYADLDGNLLIRNDPYSGAKMENGRMILPDAPGLGVKRRAE